MQEKTYTAFYLDEVQQDMSDAKQWYAGQQEGLDERFVLATKEAVFVDESNAQIIITGIVHNKRNDALSLDR